MGADPDGADHGIDRYRMVEQGVMNQVVFRVLPGAFLSVPFAFIEDPYQIEPLDDLFREPITVSSSKCQLISFD